MSNAKKNRQTQEAKKNGQLKIDILSLQNSFIHSLHMLTNGTGVGVCVCFETNKEKEKSPPTFRKISIYNW